MMQPHVLVAEDDPVTRTSLVDLLVRAGYQVSAAVDGVAACEILRHNTVDLVLTDIRMQAVDGLDVLQAAQFCTPPPAVVLLTGYGALDTALAALRGGAANYLLKPVVPEELLASIGRALIHHRQTLHHEQAAVLLAELATRYHTLPSTAPWLMPPHQPPPAPEPRDMRYIEVGQLRIDNHRHQAHFNGQILHLTPTEYALIHSLSEAMGRVVTYQDLARRTHGYELESTAAHTLLKPHIRNLRRKLDNRYVVSVRGTGYLLIDPTSPNAPSSES